MMEKIIGDVNDLKLRKTNIVFKLNYCNGGRNDKKGIFGFNGICDNDAMKNNIEVEHRAWCTHEDCACYQYYTGAITKKELKQMYEEYGSVCNESCLLESWTVNAGASYNGEPIAINNSGINSLCVLTTRFPGEEEEERCIFALFIVDKYEPGNPEEQGGSGYVACTSNYRLAFSQQEAANLKFWHFHANKNHPEKAFWGTGLFRYISDAEAVQILQKAAQIKTDPADKALAQEMLAYYCYINGIDPKLAGRPSGVLVKQKATAKE